MPVHIFNLFFFSLACQFNIIIIICCWGHIAASTLCFYPWGSLMVSHQVSASLSCSGMVTSEKCPMARDHPYRTAEIYINISLCLYWWNSLKWSVSERTGGLEIDLEGSHNLSILGTIETGALSPSIPKKGNGQSPWLHIHHPISVIQARAWLQGYSNP